MPARSIDPTSVKLYPFYIADLKTSNKNLEIAQMQDEFAMWLKLQETELSKLPCEIGSEDEIRNTTAIFNATRLRIFQSFKNFEQTMADRWKDGTLMKNPAYLVRQALELQSLDFAQRSKGLEDEWTPKFHYKFLEENPQYSVNISATGYPDEQPSSWWLKQTLHYMGESVVSVGSFLASSVGFVKSWWSGGSVPITKIYMQDPLDKALAVAARALELEDAYTWQAHNVLSYLRLMKNGAGIVHEEQAKDAAAIKRQFIEDARRAINAIYEHEIPSIESQHVYMLMYNFTTPNAADAIDLAYKSKALRKIADAINASVNLAADSQPNEMIRVKRVMSIEALSNTTNVTSTDLAIMASSARVTTDLQSTSESLQLIDKKPFMQELILGGAVIIEVETYQLEEEEEDWSGTIFSAVFGFIQVAFGLAFIAASGPFTTLLGTGFVMQGIGDVISTIASVATNQPIPVEEYFKAKAIGIAINLAIASIGAFGQGMNWWNIPDIGNPVGEFLPTAIAKVSFITAASKAVAAIAQKMVKSNDAALESMVREELNDFMRINEQTLDQIFTSDALTAETSAAQRRSACSKQTHGQIPRNWRDGCKGHWTWNAWLAWRDGIRSRACNKCRCERSNRNC